MAKQTFVADTILTAAQMNALQGNDYNQTVSTKTASYTLVAADAGTRVVMNNASASTITVNTSLFSAGDTLTLLNIGAGVCTITAGTATVSTTGSLALAQYGGGTLYFTSAGVSVFQADGVAASSSGLTLVSTTTIGSAVSSVTVSSAFSATYDNYKIVVNNGVGTAGTLSLQLGSTTTGYYRFSVTGEYSATTVVGSNTDNGASFVQIGSVSANNIDANIEIRNPFLTKNTTVSAMYARAQSPAGNLSAGMTNGWLNNSTSYTAFTLIPESATLTGGTIRVYGYANS